ncbi:MAG: hypothetical protein AAFO29_21725, partial [Actinomycetota bacterium]
RHQPDDEPSGDGGLAAADANGSDPSARPRLIRLRRVVDRFTGRLSGRRLRREEPSVDVAALD